MYVVWVYAIHIYHPIFFKTGKMDWIHHVPVYILNTMMFTVLTGPAFQAQVCILTGIPGGIDYLLQVVEGQGCLSRAIYKGWSSWINTYVRAPLAYLTGYVGILGLCWQREEASLWQSVVCVLMGVHACWNAPFFGRQAVEANIVDIVNRHELVGGSLKLPKVRSLSGKDPKPTALSKADLL
eukprot:2297947-Prymnesium_polylepis.2